MFMPETEDMLPRAAPRPSASVPLGHSDEIIKPTVPEVSILFGDPPPQQAHIQQQQQQHQQQQSASVQRPVNSFASWKKQILPRVNFAPVLTTELGPRSPPATSPVISCNNYNYLPRTRAFDADRSTPPSHSNIGYTVSGNSQYPQETYAIDHMMPASRLHNSNAATNDVLTICASTQTEPETLLSKRDYSLDLNNLADKTDIREVLTLLELMRQEQQQLRRLCESLAQQQQKQELTSSKTFKETASQCAIIVTNKCNAAVKPIKPIVQDYIVEEDEQMPAYKAPLRVTPKFESPRAVPPIAQSTGYRSNTPQGKTGLLSPASNVLTVLPKPSTEKSMAMNELALKYLPQRQINELMDELHVSPKTTNDVVANTTPLRQIENFTPSPSNMSNASYKYLKKYRLLPEENLQLGFNHHGLSTSPQGMHKMPRSPAVASPQCQEQMLDLDNIRNQPKLI